MRAIGVRRVLPDKPKEEMEEDGRLKGWTFKPPIHIRTYVEGRVHAGHRKTATLVALLDLAIYTIQDLGDLYYEVERRAKVDGVPTGRMLARLVKDSLKKR